MLQHAAGKLPQTRLHYGLGAWLAIALLVLCAAAAHAESEEEQSPRFVLYGTMERDLGLELKADWRRQRLFQGRGWELGTIGRAELEPMLGGYTVIQPDAGAPIILQHCYVLAAFDLPAGGQLLATVRDPEYYWPGYDYTQGVRNPLELVWYNEQWEEVQRHPLDYSTSEYPDDFLLSPKANVLLVIRKPEADGSPVEAGQSLNIIRLRDCAIHDLWLPEVDASGVLPGDWWPVAMYWSEDRRLVVQAGAQVRVYEVAW